LLRRRKRRKLVHDDLAPIDEPAPTVNRVVDNRPPARPSPAATYPSLANDPYATTAGNGSRLPVPTASPLTNVSVEYRTDRSAPSSPAPVSQSTEPSRPDTNGSVATERSASDATIVLPPSLGRGPSLRDNGTH